MQEKNYEKQSKIVPAVSVIVPIYNVEKYLAECVDSILGQTFQDMEIILVDDGSLDSSGQMADDYAVQDKRVKVIHKENGGLSSARNAGMKIARGEYIYFCDSDDYISLDAIEILYETATKNDLDMVLFNGDSFVDKADAGDRFQERRAAWGNAKFDRKFAYEEWGGGRGDKMFLEMYVNGEYCQSVCLQFLRRSYCLKMNLKFYEGILYEDTIYTIKALFSAEKVMFIPYKLFHRRARTGSIMSYVTTYRSGYSYFIAYCEIYKFLSENKWEDAAIQEAAKEADDYKKRFLKIMNQLDESEKARIRVLLPLLYQSLFDEMLGNEAGKKRRLSVEIQNRKLSKELRDIRHGYSFRIGRIVTWFPRKIRGGIKCFRQHGVIYTAKRTLEHLGFDMGTGDFVREK